VVNDLFVLKLSRLIFILLVLNFHLSCKLNLLKLEFDKISLIRHKHIKDINSIYNKKNLVDIPTFFLANLELRKYENK